MNSKTVIRGMAWDHPRGRGPLEAISQRWCQGRDLLVQWDARPLKDFEDQPLEELATAYDLVVIDHPFVGIAAESGLIRPVNDWVDRKYLEDQADNSAGPSFSSYTWDNKQWALAIDAACQVSAVRDDLLGSSASTDLPRDWATVMELSRSLCKANARVAVPLNPNHAYCAFLSIAHSNAGPPVLQPGKPVETDVGIEALEFLRVLSSWLHPLSRDADPIIISDHMTKSDEIAYVPLMFGYSNYARPGFRPNTLCFGDAPRGRSGLIGSVLGGVGLALSAESAVAEPAADLAREICRPQTQCGLYFDSGGQPGHAEAWRSDEVNRRAGNFFQATSRSMRQALMRPRVAGHRKFQVEAGELIHGFIWDQAMEPAQCLQSFNDLVEQRLGTGESNV